MVQSTADGVVLVFVQFPTLNLRMSEAGVSGHSSEQLSAGARLLSERVGVPGVYGNSRGSTQRPEVASLSPGDPWSLPLMNCELGASWQAQALGSPRQTWTSHEPGF